MWPLRTLSFSALFMGLCALSLVYPIVGAVNYIMIYQVDPSTSWWGKPLAELGVRFSMTAALFLALGMMANWKRLPQLRPLICTWQALLILLVVSAIVSRVIGVSVNDPRPNIILDKFIKLSVFALCLTHLGSTRRNFNIILWALVFGSLIIGYDAFNAPLDQFSSGRLDDVGGPDFRASSGLAAHMVAMLPLIGVAVLTARNWLWRIAALVSGAFTVNAVILCRTRGAFVAFLVGGAVAALMAPRRRRVRVYVAILIAVVASNALTDKHFWSRMNTLRNDEYMAQDTAATLRKRVWAAAFTMVADYPQGVGCGVFPRVIAWYDVTIDNRDPHNTFIRCCTELGIHGAFIFFLLILTAFLQLHNCRRLAGQTRDPRATSLATYGIGLSMIMYLTAGMFTDRFYVESLWWVLAMPTCLQRAVRREVAEVAPEPELESTAPALDEWGPLPAPVPG